MNYTNSRKLQKPGEIFHTLFILDANSTKLVLCYKDLEKKRNVSLTNFQSQAIVVFEQRTVHNELWRSTKILPRKITKQKEISVLICVVSTLRRKEELHILIG